MSQTQGQPQMTVQDAAATLNSVLQDKVLNMTGRELDAARAALGFLVNNLVGLSRFSEALKVEAEKAGVDVNAIIASLRQGQGQGQPIAAAKPAAPTRAERRRAAGKLAAVPAKGAPTQE